MPLDSGGGGGLIRSQVILERSSSLREEKQWVDWRMLNGEAMESNSISIQSRWSSVAAAPPPVASITTTAIAERRRWPGVPGSRNCRERDRKKGIQCTGRQQKCYKFDGLYYELIAYIGIGILSIIEEAMIHYYSCTHGSLPPPRRLLWRTTWRRGGEPARRGKVEWKSGFYWIVESDLLNFYPRQM